MAVFATLVRPQWPREALRHARTVVLYGLDPDRRRPTVLLQRRRPHVGRRGAAAGIHRARPGRRLDLGHHPAQAQHLTLAGVALAVAGIMLVLNVFGGAPHQRWSASAGALAAAVCAACYFMMSDEGRQRRRRRGPQPDHAGRGRPGRRRRRGHLLGVVGIMPLTFTDQRRRDRRWTTRGSCPWSCSAWSAPRSPTRWASAAWPGCGPASRRWSACRRCCSRCCAAWLLIGEAMTPLQAIGGAVVLAGLALARQGDRPIEAAPAERPQLATRRSP